MLNGYGLYRISGKSHSAHRFSWVLHFGSIEGKLCVLHKCDNRKCVRPDHLFLGTHKENTADMFAKKRSATGEEHKLSKLKEWQVLAIKKDTRSQKAIAKEYGVSQSCISLIKIGKNWGWLE